jgi:hypothetical protein
MNFSYMFRKAMIKPENDREAEDVTWPTFPFAATEVFIFNKIGHVQIKHFQNTLDRAWNEIRMKIQTKISLKS